MAAKEISVKKYVVRLSGEEREQLEALIRKGKSPAQRRKNSEGVVWSQHKPLIFAASHFVHHGDLTGHIGF